MIYTNFKFSVPATEKVGKESQPRFLEDEGFYVGTRPETSGWNQNRMEHRLLKEAESVRAVPELTIWGGWAAAFLFFLCMVGFH